VAKLLETETPLDVPAMLLEEGRRRDDTAVMVRVMQLASEDESQCLILAPLRSWGRAQTAM
jgi:hypothetical protein